MPNICRDCGKLTRNNDGVMMEMGFLCIECIGKRGVENKKLKAEKEQKFNDDIIKINEQIKNRLDNGRKVFLHKKIYIPVDSIINNEKVSDKFDISLIQKACLDGWEIVGTVNKTIGIGLENFSLGASTGKTWGGGLGGNVTGVYFLMKKELLLSEIPLSEEEVINCFMG